MYPLLPYVMKEYAVCQSNNEFMFSTMLRSARNQIECAFGRLKARWRILRRFEDIPDIVLACFVLHNFCEERNIEPILADMDKVIIMERVNAPTKDIVTLQHERWRSHYRCNHTIFCGVFVG